MIKKFRYIIFALISVFCFNGLVLAEEKSCTYIKMTNNSQSTVTDEYGTTYPTYYVYFKVSSENSLSDFSTNINDNLTSVSNWNDNFQKFGVEISGKSYFESNKKCAPYIVSIGGEIFAVDDKNLTNIKNFAKQNGSSYVVMSLSSSKYTINYHSGSRMSTGEMNSVELNDYYYFGPMFLNNEFENQGYMKLGWTVQCDGKWLCKLSNSEIGYSSSCSDDNKVLLKDYESHYIPVISSSSSVDLYMRWKPISIYEEGFILDLTENDCKAKGYVWNKEGYCNNDNLQYVMCGDSYDIPAQVPSLLSFAVNLLKIATPIILIIVSVITLVKAMISTKEDEIKKAQNSLVRRVIAAVLVFFVIGIVQFVILKVADDSDHKSISSCLSCFLNNDCDTVKYYKTNISGNYYCTTVGSSSSQLCEVFYKNSNNQN